MLADLDHRGVKADRARRFVIGGSKALRSAIRDVYGQAGARAALPDPQVHNVHNVTSHLPKDRHGHVRQAMRQADKSRKPNTAKRQLQDLARSLQNKHPGTAASLREGLDESLRLSRATERSFGTTNPPHAHAFEAPQDLEQLCVGLARVRGEGQRRGNGAHLAGDRRASVGRAGEVRFVAAR